MQEFMRVYLDNNATTRVDERVADCMRTFFLEDYAIASSQFSHSMGIKAKEAVENARGILSGSINAEINEVIFTSGGTESNNLVIQGLINTKSKRKKIVLSPVEHFSVLHPAQNLRERGFILEFCNVDEEGFADLDHLRDIVDDSTLLVSVIHGNHETGTLQDIKSIAQIAHEKGAYFHTDASVSFGQLGIDVKSLQCDFLTISAHKIHGPKGVGALYIRDGIKINKLIHGGFSENNLRGGTENVPGIAGFGKAVEMLCTDDVNHAGLMRNNLYEQIKSEIDSVRLNGPCDFQYRLPNNLNLSFDFIEGESIVLHLDLMGIAVITGSACFSKSLQASHILMAMGFSHERAHSSVRFSTSKETTQDQIDYTVDKLKGIVSNLRRLSPLFNNSGGV